MGGFFKNKEIKPKMFTPPSAAPGLELLGLGQFDFSGKQGLERSGPSQFNLFNTAGMGQIADYLRNPIQQTGSELAAGQLVQPLPGQLAESEAFFGENIAPALEELVTTGFRSDTEGIRRAAMGGFREEALPMIYENLAGDFGLSGTHTGNIAQREARGLMRDLAD